MPFLPPYQQRQSTEGLMYTGNLLEIGYAVLAYCVVALMIAAA